MGVHVPGVPEAYPGVPGTYPGVPGAYPGVRGDEGAHVVVRRAEVLGTFGTSAYGWD